MSFIFFRYRQIILFFWYQQPSLFTTIRIIEVSYSYHCVIAYPILSELLQQN